MAKIFISHSSVDNAAALAVAQWLAENGWDDFFLDIEPARGLSPGERWQEALKAASDRCEAVLCLISPAWRDSPWCIAELFFAKQLGKAIFGAFIEPTPLESLPREMTAEWQFCDLVEGSARRVFQVCSDPVVPATEVSFAVPGFERLKRGLQRAGLDAATFPWPPPGDPDRAPYRGFKALAAEDAAVFFGREADMVRGLDSLRRLRERDVERMLVLLGASGAGKSSFLRAGLWPRLGRDDRRFLPLPVIRPERAVIAGPSGLAASLEAAFRRLKQARSRAGIRSVLAEPGGLDRLLAELQSLASHRLGPDAPPPTVVLGIDQAEEMLSAEGRAEAETFLSLLARALDPAGRRVMAVLAIRSDSFERLQAEPLLARAQWALFDLRPLARAEYKAVVEGPAARATAAGRPLRIDPELIERLLGEAEGADALPLLAFTLERLFVEHGGDGALNLPEYEALGGLRGSIEEVVKAAFAEPGREPAIPADEAERTRRLKEGFIPWLARIDPDTEERKRRVARREELPAESRPLIERLITARLLLSDRRRVGGHDGEVVIVEVAHEALLRQWPTLTAWLDEDAAELKALEATRRAAGEWRKNGDKADWLTHTGDRLRAAEVLRQRPDFDRLLGEEGRAYLKACRRRDDQLQEEREIQARRVARAQRRTWVLQALITVIILCAAISIVNQTRRVARQTSLVLAANALAANDAGHHDRALRLAVLAAHEGWLSPAAPEAEAQLARAAHASSLIAQTRHIVGVDSASFSPDGRWVVSASSDSARVWDAATGKVVFEVNADVMNSISTAFLSPDGRRVVSSSFLGAVRVWDAATGKALSEVKNADGRPLSFSLDGRRGVSASLDGTVRVWDAATGQTFAEVKHEKLVKVASFSRDGSRVVSASLDGIVRVWDAATGKTFTEMRHDKLVTSVSFSRDGSQVVSASLDGTVRVWAATTGKVLSEVRYHGTSTFAFFSPDGSRVVGASEDGTVRIWDAATGEPLAEVKHDGSVSAASFSLDGRWVVSASEDGAVRVWDASTGRTLIEVKHDARVNSASFSPDGKWVVSASEDGTACVWSASPGSPLAEVKNSSAMLSVTFSPDGRSVVSGSDDGTVRVWDVVTRKPLAEVKNSSAVLSVSVSPDGQRVVSGANDGTVHFWDRSRHSLREAKHEKRVGSVSFSPDGQWVVSAAAFGTVRVLDAETGKSIAENRNRDLLLVRAFASFSPDGRRVVSAAAFGTMRVWDASQSNGQRQADLLLGGNGPSSRGGIASPIDPVISAAFSLDGLRILGVTKKGRVGVWDAGAGRLIAEVKNDAQVSSATLSRDNRRVVGVFDAFARIWDAATGQTLTEMKHEHEVNTASFSLDGRRLVTASEDRTARVWNTQWLALHGQNLIDAVCREKLNGAKVLSSRDIEVAPVLRGREGKEVCAPATWLDRLRGFLGERTH